jgi:ABC-type phosphate transport system substrate-binding protein
MHAPPAPTRPRVALTALVAAAVLVAIAGGDLAAAASGGVVVVVSARSPLTSISRLHLADLYLGRTSHFPDGRPAEPIDQEAGSPARALFYETHVGRSEAQIKAHWSKIIFTGRGRPPRQVSGDAAVVELLAANPQAIGYVEGRLVDERVRVVRIE